MLRDERGQDIAFLIVLFFLVLVALVAYTWWESRPQKKISIEELSFETPELSPGQRTTLTVKIKNMSDKTPASDVSVTVSSFSQSVVQVVGENPQLVSDLAPGNIRIVEFIDSITIALGARKGTYTIGITVSLPPESPFEGDEEEASITVK